MQSLGLDSEFSTKVSFPSGAVVKNLPAEARDAEGSIPGLGALVWSEQPAGTDNGLCSLYITVLSLTPDPERPLAIFLYQRRHGSGRG